MFPEDFEQKWHLHLGLPPVTPLSTLQMSITRLGETLLEAPWEAVPIAKLDMELDALPDLERRQFLQCLQWIYLFAYDFQSDLRLSLGFHYPPAPFHPSPSIVGVNNTMLTQPSLLNDLLEGESPIDAEGREKSLKVALYQAVLLEELLHALDRKLKQMHSPYASGAFCWKRVKYTKFSLGKTSPRPDLPDLKQDETSSASGNYRPEEFDREDFATVMVWYTLRPSRWPDPETGEPQLGLEQLDPEYFAFAHDLFTHLVTQC